MMSTAVGSIADNSSGNIYAYRASKAAMNMVMKNLSVELKDKGVLVLALHPGWVQTEMGGPKAQITTEESVTGMVKTLGQMTEANQGGFKRYNNTDIPW